MRRSLTESRPDLSELTEPPANPDVVVYELDVSGQRYIEDDDGRVIAFEALHGATRMHESSATLFILSFSAGAVITDGRYQSSPHAESDQTTFAAVCKSIDLALENGSTVCFVIFPGTPFPYHSRAGSHYELERIAAAEASSLLSFVDNVIGFRLLDEAGIRMGLRLLQTDIQARVHEFAPFTRRYAVAEYRLIGRGVENVTVNATAGDEPVAIVSARNRGHLLWMPLRNSTDADDLLSAIKALVGCISTYRSKTLADEPIWVRDQFGWSGEAAVRKQEAQALAVLEEAKPLSERYSHLRRILWARDDPLRVAVSDFLRAIGLPVEDNERYREDFWLLDNGERVAIGEVKGINSNVTPSHLARLVSHRKDAGLPDEFPGIFITLTFANVESVEKRRIEPNVCRRAKEDNILIMRTIDLARFCDEMSQGKDGFAPEALWQHLKAGGGWLEVRPDSIALRTQ